MSRQSIRGRTLGHGHLVAALEQSLFGFDGAAIFEPLSKISYHLDDIEESKDAERDTSGDFKIGGPQ
jgi:hypothetical protein